MTGRTIKLWLPVIVLAFFPAVARADAGTPLMWAGTFHLLFGNAIIGVAEGLLLAVLFRQKGAPCVPIMIAANYFSAWVGMFAYRRSRTLPASISTTLGGGFGAWSP